MAQFVIGNKDAEKWTEDKVREVFIEMLEKTCNDENILSLQDAIKAVGLYRSSLDYLLEKFPVFGSLKKDIQDLVIGRLNNGGLKGDFNPTIVIWRSKQLGEKDTQYQNVESNVTQTNVISLGSGKKPKE